MTEALLHEHERHQIALSGPSGAHPAGPGPMELSLPDQADPVEAVNATDPGSREVPVQSAVAPSPAADQLEKAIILTLKSLSSGADRLHEAAIAERVTGFLLASFERMAISCGPSTWEAALQV